MAQRKETKKIKVRDLKPRKDAKGGTKIMGPGGQHPQTGPQTGPQTRITY